MDDTSKSLTDEERRAVFAAWMKPLPVKKPRETLVTRVAPWRYQFIAAVAQGYSWDQLAKTVAIQPEIGLKVNGPHLKKCVYQAFAAADELVPGGRKDRRRRKRGHKSRETAADTAKKPAISTGETVRSM